MRIFKTKAFARQARRAGIPDASLIKAVDEAESGLIEADLGGAVIKQRIARAGQGKSGGYRAILSYSSKTRSVFMYMFAKNVLANISDNELITLREFSRKWLSASDVAVERAKSAGEIIEVVKDGQSSSKKGPEKAVPKKGRRSIRERKVR